MVYSVRAHFHVSVAANYFCSLDEQCPFVTKVALLQPFGVGMGQDLVGQKYRGDPSATNSLRDRHREKHHSGFRSNLEA